MLAMLDSLKALEVDVTRKPFGLFLNMRNSSQVSAKGAHSGQNVNADWV